MISKRCTSLNLLNHIKQKQIPHTIEYEFFKDKTQPNFLKWVGTLKINGKTFQGIGENKNSVLVKILKNAEMELHSLSNI